MVHSPMRNLKKLLAILLAAAMLLSFGSIASAAPVASYSEETQAKIQDAGEFLQMLGIVGSGDLNLDRTLTRAEMATILYWMVTSTPMNAAVESGLKETKIFNDVSNEWYTPYINWANQSNLMAGTGGSNFSPLREVTGVEAVILMAKVLGISEKHDWDLQGKAWNEIMIPMLLKAESWFGLPGNFNVDLNKDLTRGEIFMIFRKALESYYVEYADRGNLDQEGGKPEYNNDGYYPGNINSGSGQSGLTYSRTQLEKVYGWRQVVGVVVANEFINLDPSILRYDWTKVDNSLPKTGNVTVGVYGRDFNSANTQQVISWSINGYYDVPLPEGNDTVLDKYSWLAQEVSFYAQVDAKTEQITKLYSPEIEQTGRTFTGTSYDKKSNGTAGTFTDNGYNGYINDKAVTYDWTSNASKKHTYLYNGYRNAEGTRGTTGNTTSGEIEGIISPAAYASGSGWVNNLTTWTDRWGAASEYSRSVSYAFHPTFAQVTATGDEVTFKPVAGNKVDNLNDNGQKSYNKNATANRITNLFYNSGGTSLLSEKKIKAEDIVEGAELLETDALVGIFHVGNGKYVVIETEEVKTALVNKISDRDDWGNTFRNAITYGDNTSDVKYASFGAVVKDFYNQVQAGEAMTNYRFVLCLNEIVLAERLNDVVFYGAVVSSGLGSSNYNVTVLNSDGVTGTYKLNLSGEAGNVESKWSYRTNVNLDNSGSRNQPGLVNDAGDVIPLTKGRDLPLMVEYRVDGDVATIRRVDTLNTLPDADGVNLISAYGSYNGTYQYRYGLSNDIITFRPNVGTASNHLIGADKIFAFYNNNITAVSASQVRMEDSGAAQNTVAGLVINAMQPGTTRSWDPVFVALENVSGTYETVSAGYYTRTQKARNLTTGEEVTLTFRWNWENDARNKAGIVAKGQIFQCAPNAANVVLMYNDANAVRNANNLVGYFLHQVPAGNINKVNNRLNVYGGQKTQSDGSGLTYTKLNKAGDTPPAVNGSIGDLGTNSVIWTLIHEDDIEYYTKNGLATSDADLKSLVPFYGVLYGSLTDVTMPVSRDIVVPVPAVASYQFDVVNAAVGGTLSNVAVDTGSVTVTLTAKAGANGTGATVLYNGAQSVELTATAVVNGEWTVTSGNATVLVDAVTDTIPVTFVNGVATFTVSFDTVGVNTFDFKVAGATNQYPGTVNVTVIDPNAAGPYDGLTEAAAAQQISDDYTAKLTADALVLLAVTCGGDAVKFEALMNEMADNLAVLLTDVAAGTYPNDTIENLMDGWVADYLAANPVARLATRSTNTTWAALAAPVVYAAAGDTTVIVKVDTSNLPNIVILIYVKVGDIVVPVAIPNAATALDVFGAALAEELGEDELAELYGDYDVEVPGGDEDTDAEKVAAAIERIEALEVTTEELAFDADAEAIEAAVIEAVEAALGGLELDDVVIGEIAFDGDETVTIAVSCGAENGEATLTVTVVIGEEGEATTDAEKVAEAIAAIEGATYEAWDDVVEDAATAKTAIEAIIDELDLPVGVTYTVSTPTANSDDWDFKVTVKCGAELDITTTLLLAVLGDSDRLDVAVGLIEGADWTVEADDVTDAASAKAAITAILGALDLPTGITATPGTPTADGDDYDCLIIIRNGTTVIGSVEITLIVLDDTIRVAAAIVAIEGATFWAYDTVVTSATSAKSTLQTQINELLAAEPEFADVTAVVVGNAALAVNDTDYEVSAVLVTCGDVEDTTTAAQITLAIYKPAQTVASAVSAVSGKVGSATPVAGANNWITITVKDNNSGATDLTFNGAKDVTIKGVKVAPNGSYGSFNGVALTNASDTTGQVISVTFTNGVATVPIILNKAGAATIVVSVAGVNTPAAAGLTITPAAAALAAITSNMDVITDFTTAGAFETASVGADLTITLVDQFGNTRATDNATKVLATADVGALGVITTAQTASTGVVDFKTMTLTLDDDELADVITFTVVSSTDGTTPVEGIATIELIVIYEVV